MDAMLRGKAEELAKEIAVSISTQQELSDVMRMMTKSVIERMLDAEMDVHLGEERSQAANTNALPNGPLQDGIPTPAATRGSTPKAATARRNRRNGATTKTVQGEPGQLTITTPRDRNGTFEPLLIPKYERRLAGFDDKILALASITSGSFSLKTWCRIRSSFFCAKITSTKPASTMINNVVKMVIFILLFHMDSRLNASWSVNVHLPVLNVDRQGEAATDRFDGSQAKTGCAHTGHFIQRRWFIVDDGVGKGF